MTKASREITRAAILPMDRYAALREERRARLREVKKHRRVEVGPFAAFCFENYETMWMQVHEMLYIEKGGEAQIDAELTAYNPLIPKGRELIATMMFEIDDRGRRDRALSRLGGVEHTVTLNFADEAVMAVPADDVERTSSAGKTSSVHFLHFPFTDQQVVRFRGPGVRVILGIGHENYAHLAVIRESVRRALAQDFD